MEHGGNTDHDPEYSLFSMFHPMALSHVGTISDAKFDKSGRWFMNNAVVGIALIRCSPPAVRALEMRQAISIPHLLVCH